MQPIEYIAKKYNLDLKEKSPIKIHKSRWHEMPVLFKELGYKEGAEVGVLKGEFTKKFCNQGMKMHAIDAWMFYHTYNDFRKQWQLDEYEKEARERLKNCDCDIYKAWSTDAVKMFKDESLDFVFLDGNHDFRHVTEDIDEWIKKVKKGGIIAGHDFMRKTRKGEYSPFMHVKDVVTSYTYAYQIKPWFVFTDDKCPSWFWVKQ